MFGKTIVKGSMAAALPSCVSISILLGLLVSPVRAQTLTVLASFNNSNGFSPVAGLTLSGNTLYGTTEFGGAFGDGTVFALTLPTPEPGTLALVGATAVALVSHRWRRGRMRRRNGREEASTFSFPPSSFLKETSRRPKEKGKWAKGRYRNTNYR